MIVTQACPQCGKEFSYSNWDGRTRTYCSRACQKAAKRVVAHCPECGKEFWHHATWPRIYCSRKCSAANNAKTNLGIVELPPQFCEQCGVEITKDKRTGRRFCSPKCFGEWFTKHVVGENHPNHKDGVTRICKHCGNEFEVKPYAPAAGEGVFCNRACKAAWQQLHPPKHRPEPMYGPNNPRWKGGTLPYYGPNWRPQRRNARRRDNYTCQRCGKTESEIGKQLDVHHIVPFREFGVERYKEANALSNLISLCYRCHTWVENHGLGDS